MAQPVVVVHGVKDIVPGTTPSRLEINDLIRNEKYWSLYVQAFTNLKHPDKKTPPTDPVNDPLAYYQLNGIHGYPRRPWNGATTTKPGDYCQHHTRLFATWHRAYCLLFEQSIQQEAVAIAQKYTVDKEAWVKAATTLRQPYWDFALAKPNEPMLPAEFTSDYITITRSDGKKDDKFPNPFLSYTWPTNLDAATKRVLNGETERVEDYIDDLRATQPQRRFNIFRAITRLRTWNEISTGLRTSDDGAPVSSLEAIHDGVHMAIGGSMEAFATAAFDPIFHFLHCAIDRYMAIWSALHPNQWLKDTTDLQPFRDTPSSRWRSAGLEDIRKFNYTYPELDGLDVSKPNGQAWLNDLLAHLYDDTHGPHPHPGPKPGSTARSAAHPARVASGAALLANSPAPVASVVAEHSPAPAASVVAEHSPAPAASVVAEHSPAPAASVVAEHSEAEEVSPTDSWTVRIRCKPYEAGGSFSVLVFTGNEADLPANPKEWLYSPGFTGRFSVFANNRPEECENCTNSLERQVEVEGYVQLDEALQHQVKSLKANVVEPYLKNNLYWRAVKRENNTNKVIALPSLEVVVRQDIISKQPGESTITYSGTRYHKECTAHRSYQV